MGKGPTDVGVDDGDDEEQVGRELEREQGTHMAGGVNRSGVGLVKDATDGSIPMRPSCTVLPNEVMISWRRDRGEIDPM